MTYETDSLGIHYYLVEHDQDAFNLNDLVQDSTLLLNSLASFKNMNSLLRLDSCASNGGTRRDCHQVHSRMHTCIRERARKWTSIVIWLAALTNVPVV